MWADGNDSACRRVLRSVWPGANPLRRRTDWFEPCALVGVLLAVVVAVILSITTAEAVLRTHLDEVRVEQATRHQVVATVEGQVEEQGAMTRSVTVRWGLPPDPPRSATVRVPASAELGVTLPIWLGSDGQPVPPPKTRADATEASGTAGAGALLGCSIITAMVFGAARWWVGRRRLAAWEAEWAWVGPQWRNHTT